MAYHPFCLFNPTPPIDPAIITLIDTTWWDRERYVLHIGVSSTVSRRLQVRTSRQSPARGLFDVKPPPGLIDGGWSSSLGIDWRATFAWDKLWRVDGRGVWTMASSITGWTYHMPPLFCHLIDVSLGVATTRLDLRICTCRSVDYFPLMCRCEGDIDVCMRG